MADTSSVLEATPFTADDLARAEEFTREPFVHEGEDAAAALAPGSPRRRALEDALAEIEAQAGRHFDPEVVEAFLPHAGDLVREMEALDLLSAGA